MDIDLNISIILAHTIMYEQEQLYPSIYCKEFHAGGDPPAPTPQETTAQSIASLTQGLPGLLKVISSNAPAYEQSQADLAKTIAPQQAALQAELYRLYGPQLNDTGSDIARSNALSQAETDRLVTGSPGAQALVSNTNDLQKTLDPEFYKNREIASSKFQDLLSGMDPNKLTSGEIANVERTNNRSNIGRGIADSDSNIGAIGNALQFDNRLQAKKSALSQALANFSNIQAGSKSGVDAFQLTTGKPSNTSFGQNNLTSANQNQFSNVSNQANGLLGNIFQSANNSANINSQRRDSLDRFNETDPLGKY